MISLTSIFNSMKSIGAGHIASPLKMSCLACLTAGFLVGTPALAQLELQVGACAKITDDRTRLACFDRAVAAYDVSSASLSSDSASLAPGNEKQSGAEKKPTTLASSKKQNAEDSFGADNLRKPKKAEAQKLDSVIVSSQKNRYGKLTVTLANGQVWRQISADNNRLNVPRKISKSGIPVEIKKGALGSHRMKLVGSKRTIKVRRVK